MKLVLFLVILAVVGAVGWYGYCVVPVMDDFQAAVDSGKPEAIQPFLDTPALKKNVADYTKLRYNKTDTPSTNLSPEAIQALVDPFVTPKTIQLVMKCVKVEPGSIQPETIPAGPPPFPIEKHYESPDVYAIDVYLSSVQTPDNRITLLFARDGWFDWKLAGFRFAWNG